MSGWVDQRQQQPDESGSADGFNERQRLQAPAVPSGKSTTRILAAKSLLLIWTLFMLGFVLILCASVAYSAGFGGAGTGCLLSGLASLVAASIWQWRISGARLAELGRSSAYPHMPAAGAGGPLNIQDDAEGPAPGFHF